LPMTWELVASGALGGAASGVVVTLVNHLLSRKQFVSERWWERKVSAYSVAMERLASINMTLYDCIEELEDPDPDQETWDKYLARWEREADALGVLAHQETFLISSEAMDCLMRIHEALAALDDDQEKVLAGLKVFAVAFRAGKLEFVHHAKADLGVARPWWARWRGRDPQRTEEDRDSESSS